MGAPYFFAGTQCKVEAMLLCRHQCALITTEKRTISRAQESPRWLTLLFKMLLCRREGIFAMLIPVHNVNWIKTTSNSILISARAVPLWRRTQVPGGLDLQGVERPRNSLIVPLAISSLTILLPFQQEGFAAGNSPPSTSPNPAMVARVATKQLVWGDTAPQLIAAPTQRSVPAPPCTQAHILPQSPPTQAEIRPCCYLGKATQPA